MASSWVDVDAGGRTLRVSSPEKVVFPGRGETKLDLVGYYLTVGDGIVRALHERPTVMHRFQHGAAGEGFFQKRIPDKGRPEWLKTVEVQFPYGGRAVELCPVDLAHVVWAVNLGCLESHPWAVRRRDLLRPDELRVDLDPSPGAEFPDVQRVAQCAREVLAEAGIVSYPKTSGGRGIHVYARLQPRWGYLQLRRAVLALAREVERRLPEHATAAWWKEERGERVFLDFNQNLPDRTVASAYSVRPGPDGHVSCPLRWDEVPDAEPADFTIATVPERFAAIGDPAVELDAEAYSIEPLLEMAERDEANGQGEAPFPPHFPKVADEPRRVSPSRARKDG